jgi:hypothetical protein
MERSNLKSSMKEKGRLRLHSNRISAESCRQLHLQTSLKNKGVSGLTHLTIVLLEQRIHVSGG